ncbi:TPA: redoxin domain-containing protein [Candidatus Avigastranaerophilus faecigallinarum]|nr:redoxin domain-containing protein [Candidatus Avigastranaerophilus faecigallinarum]
MKKKFFIGLFIVVAVCFAAYTYIVFNSSLPVYKPQQNLQAPIEIPSKAIISFKEAEAIDKPMVIMFYVDWCGYCRKYMPIFGEFADKYKDKYSFVAVNCDNPDNTKLVEKFHIMGFPSLFVSDKKIEHNFSLNMASTSEKSIMKEELDNYLKVREKFFK